MNAQLDHFSSLDAKSKLYGLTICTSKLKMKKKNNLVNDMMAHLYDANAREDIQIML